MVLVYMKKRTRTSFALPGRASSRLVPNAVSLSKGFRGVRTCDASVSSSSATSAPKTTEKSAFAKMSQGHREGELKRDRTRQNCGW